MVSTIKLFSHDEAYPPIIIILKLLIAIIEIILIFIAIAIFASIHLSNPPHSLPWSVYACFSKDAQHCNASPKHWEVLNCNTALKHWDALHCNASPKQWERYIVMHLQSTKMRNITMHLQSTELRYIAMHLESTKRCYNAIMRSESLGKRISYRNTEMRWDAQ